MQVATSRDVTQILGQSRNFSNLAEAVIEVVARVLPRHATSTNFISSDDCFHVADFKDEMARKLPSTMRMAFRFISTTKIRKMPARRIRSNIFVVDSFDDFLDIYRKITTSVFRFNGYYLVVLTNGRFEEIREIFRLFWSLHIFKTNVMFLDENDEVSVETFLPFTAGSCHNTEPVLINKFTNGNFTNGIEWFYPDKLSRLHNCTVRVAISNNSEPNVFVKRLADSRLDLSGRDISLIEALSEAINFHIDYTFIGPDEVFYPNGSAQGPLRALLDGVADISASNWILKENRVKFLGSSTAYVSDAVVFVIPQGRELTSFEKIIFPFSVPVWLSIVACFLLGCVAIFVVSRRTEAARDFVFGAGVGSPYVNLAVGCIGGSQNVLPKRNFARFLLTLFLLYTLVIRTLYQGSLFELLKKNKHHKKVQSIDEMVRKDFKFYVPENDADLFDGVEALKGRSAELPKPKQFTPTHDSNIFRIEIVDDKKFTKQSRRVETDPLFKAAYPSSLQGILYENKKRPKAKRIKHCADVYMAVPIVMYMRKYFYLTESLNAQIEALKATGFIEFWHSYDIDHRLLNFRDIRQPKVFNFKQMIGGFQILMFGFALSFAAFAAEMLTARMRR